MRAHVVHAHSESDSFVTAMHDVIAAQLTEDGHEVSISDLYAKGFTLLVFTFSTYWFGASAILKGWFYRVRLSGICYGAKRMYGCGGLADKRSFVAMSLGGREHMLGEEGSHGEHVLGMMRHMFRGTLGYAGTTVLEPYLGCRVPYIGDEAGSSLLNDLRKIVEDIENRAELPVPNLEDSDEKLVPLRKKVSS